MAKKPPAPRDPPPETAPFTATACDNLSKMQADRLRLAVKIQAERVTVKAQQEDFDSCPLDNPERKKLAERLCDSMGRLDKAKAHAKDLDELVWTVIAQACQNDLEFGNGEPGEDGAKRVIDAAMDAAEEGGELADGIRPKKGSGVESVTISSGGRSVTLKAKE